NDLVVELLQFRELLGHMSPEPLWHGRVTSLDDDIHSEPPGQMVEGRHPGDPRDRRLAPRSSPTIRGRVRCAMLETLAVRSASYASISSNRHFAMAMAATPHGTVPAARKARAASRTLAPVVTTSSTTTTQRSWSSLSAGRRTAMASTRFC